MVAAVVITALVLVGLLGLYVWRGSAPETPFVIKVPGNLQWTDSGHELRQGQRIRITAGGVVSSSSGVRSGPEGSPEYHELSYLPQISHGALIAKVGNAGVPFVVGRGPVTRTVGAGRLYLGVNDLAVRDNSGYYQVEVVVT